MTRVRAAGLIVASFGAALIALATLTPQPGPFARVPVWCLFCGSHGLQDFTLNVALFIPLGIGLRLATGSTRRSMLIVLASTVTIELLQLDIVRGRDSTLGDVVANGLGGWLGAVTVARWRGITKPHAASALRLVIAGIVCWLALLTGGAWAMQSDASTLRYYGQRAPALGHLDQFSGIVIDARLDGAALRIGLLTDEHSIRSRLGRDTVELMATATVGRASRRLAPIVSVFDEGRREIILLGRKRDDAVFRVRLRAERAGLRAPALRLREAFSSSSPGLQPDDTVRLLAARRGASYELRIERPDGVRRIERPLRVTESWSLLAPIDYHIGDLDPWAPILFLAAPLALLAYWGGRAAGASPAPTRVSPARWVSIALMLSLACVIALVLVPLHAGLAPTRWWEWLGAVAAIVAGLFGAYRWQIT